MVTMGLALVLKPSLRTHAGHVLAGQRDQEQRSATLSMALSENSGRVNTGAARQLQPAQVDALLQQQEGQAQRQDARRHSAR